MIEVITKDSRIFSDIYWVTTPWNKRSVHEYAKGFYVKDKTITCTDSYRAFRIEVDPIELDIKDGFYRINRKKNQIEIDHDSDFIFPDIDRLIPEDLTEWKNYPDRIHFSDKKEITPDDVKTIYSLSNTGIYINPAYLKSLGSSYFEVFHHDSLNKPVLFKSYKRIALIMQIDMEV